MDFDINAAIAQGLNYLENEFLPKLIAGNIVAWLYIAAALVALVVVLYLLYRLTRLVFPVVKRFLLFLIITISVAMFFVNFRSKIIGPEPDFVIIAMGALGVLFALISLFISVISIRREVEKAIAPAELKEAIKEEVSAEIEKRTTIAAQPRVAATQLQQPEMLTKQALQQQGIWAGLHDRSLLAVLSYMVVAEFGVISGITVAAPNATVGIAFFSAFYIAAFIFIKTSYHDYKMGIKHLLIASIFGISLSIALGHFWIGTSLEALLSLNYFTTNSLVAFVTGLAVSLFMGSRG